MGHLSFNIKVQNFGYLNLPCASNTTALKQPPSSHCHRVSTEYWVVCGECSFSFDIFPLSTLMNSAYLDTSHTWGHLIHEILKYLGTFHMYRDPSDCPCPFLASLSQLSDLWWMLNSVCLGFGTIMRTGSSRWFKLHPTTCMWVSSWLLFTVD